MAVLLSLPVVASLPVSAGSSSIGAPTPPLHGFRLLGAAPQNLPVLVTLAIPLRNLPILDSLVMQISDPASPSYRHFLSTQQVKSEFLPTGDFESLMSYLTANGFKVEMTALDSEIVVEGTAGQFQSAFGGGINTYTNGTYTYYASSGVSTFGGAYLYASNGTFLFEKPAAALGPRPSSNVTFTSDSFSAKKLQPVYNATYLYSHGYNGTGQTIGLLDYYGSPTIASDLSAFDKTFGFPDAKLNIIPVGPYDPSLGAYVGWSTEIALDVEASHAMAPGAAVDLYVANGALPLSVPLAQIVQDDKVTTLSQSFGNFEWFFSQSMSFGGPTFFAMQALIPDQYYALGSVEGISFLASSGDGGGGGYSSGPEGDLEYPATSPFVTSVGGTQTYFTQLASGGTGFVQTAWSNIGYVPNLVNAGGGGGGVSILEPKPWYQSKQATPPSFPNGRLNPDLSLQAGVDPAMEIIDSGKVTGTGGTSESSPLLAGLLTLVAQSLKGDLGLINPLIYMVGNDPAEYQKGFTPITFGYIIPWKASFGYNLATGWGSPNVGELARLLNTTSSQPELNIQGQLYNSTGQGQVDFTPGQNLTVSAKIDNAGVAVTSGSFTLELQTLQGTFSPTSMRYNSTTGNWTGTITMGKESGISYVYLSGSSRGGVPGQAIGTLFAGYLASITVTGSAYFLPVDPWTWSPSGTLSLSVSTSDISGKPAPAGPVTLNVEPYSISSNKYTNSSSVTLTGTGTGAVDGYLSQPAPDGPLSLVLQGDTYGYAPTVYGIYLQSGYIYPDVAAEPGSVAPGQYLTVIANPIAPVNVYFNPSLETPYILAFDVFVGSNVTATLVSPSGTTLSTANLAYQPCAQALKVCNGGANAIYGQLLVPSGTPTGLYTVMLHASYGSLTPGGNLTGTFYGQVWVSGPVLVPSVAIEPGFAFPTTPGVTHNGTAFPASAGLFEGEQAHVVARIAYANHTIATSGEFTALIYPASLSNQYSSLMHSEYAGGELIGLVYDPGTSNWIGNVTLPSSSGQGGLAGLGITSFDYAGPYEAYVTGLTSDGNPTTSQLGAQQPFTIQPYVYRSGTVSSLAGMPSAAFYSSTIIGSGSMTGDLFLGSNSIDGATVSIASSRIQGSLELSNSNVTLIGVSGGSIHATGSTVILKDSSVDSLVLSKSRVIIMDSSYGVVTPALPSISAGGLSKPLGSDSKFNVTVSGSGLTPGSLSAWIDGAKVNLKVNSTANGLVAVGKINATLLNDGVHSLVVTASQSDGLSSSLTAPFSTNAHQSALDRQTTILFIGAIATAGVAVVALIVGIIALRRRRPVIPPPFTPPPHV